MSPETIKITTRLLGLLAGVALALLLIAGSRPSAADPRLPAKLSATLAASGELEVQPQAPEQLLNEEALRPGDATQATFTLRNQTGSTLAVRLRADAAESELDSLLRIRLTSPGHPTLADTTLQALRNGSDELALDSGERATVKLRAWLPGIVDDGYQGRRLELTLTPGIELQR